jgi:hypothetical protein
VRLKNVKPSGKIEVRGEHVPGLDLLYQSMYQMLNEKHRRIADDAPYGAPMDKLLREVSGYYQDDIDNAKYWGVTPMQHDLLRVFLDPSRPRTVIERKK